MEPQLPPTDKPQRVVAAATATQRAAPAAGSIDCHAHVFHPGLRFIEARRYLPRYDASLPRYLEQLDGNGIGAGVAVALSVLGTDNSYLLECLRHADGGSDRSDRSGRLRGVAAIDPVQDLAKFDDFQAAGIVGLRLNLTGELPVPTLAQGAWAEAVAECVRRDWHVEINDRCGRLHRSVEPLLNSGVRIVVDHFGMPDRQLGVADPGFTRLLAYAASRRVWVKLSGDYRFGPATADQAAPQLLQAFGAERLLWGSDWPFTQHESSVSYAGQLARLERWVPDAAAREAVLRRTPRELFKFDAAA